MLYLSTETSSMITEKNSVLLVLSGIAPCPMHTVVWVYTVTSSFSSFSHLNPQWVFCSGKEVSFLLHVLLDQRHLYICKCSVPFYTIHLGRNGPRLVISISDFGIPRVRWSDCPRPFLCPNEHTRTI